MPTLQEKISAALSTVPNPRTGADVLAAEMVTDIATTTDGKVRLTLLLGAADDATIVRDVRQAIEAIPGVIDVRIDVRDSRQAYREPTPARQGNPNVSNPDQRAASSLGGARKPLPVMDAAPTKAPPKVPEPVPTGSLMM